MIPKKHVPDLIRDGKRFPAFAKPASAGEGRSEKIMRAKNSMRARRNALFCLVAAATLILAAAGGAFAQKQSGRGPSPNISTSKQPAPSALSGGGYQGGGYRGPGWGTAVPGVLMGIPQAYPPRGGQFVDDGDFDGGPQGPRQPQQGATRR